MRLFLPILSIVCIILSGCQNTPTSPIAVESIPETADLAVQFTKNKDKYAKELRILDEKTELNRRIKSLLGPEYGAFAERLAIQSPIEQDGNVFFFSACAPSACTFDEAAVAYDTEQKNLWVCIVKEGIPTVKSEQNLAQPKVLTKYLENLQ